MEYGLLAIVVPVVAGFLGGLFGVYYRESLAVARSQKVMLARIRLMLQEFQREMLESTVREFFTLGLVVNERYLSAIGVGGAAGLDQIRKQQDDLREKLREGLGQNEELRGQVLSLYDRESQTSPEYLQRQIKLVEREIERLDVSELPLGDIAQLPGNSGFQAMRFRDLYRHLLDWGVDRFYHLVYGVYQDDAAIMQAFETFCVNLIETSSMSVTLMRNVEFWEKRSILRLAVSQMFRSH